MFVMTTKVNIKKVLILFGAVAGVILAVLLIFSGTGKQEAVATGAPTVSGNDARVQFLTDLGWEVSASPTESGQVQIPKVQSPVFSRYNDLQKSQGYDLQEYAGKNVMRYVYKVNNYPDATEPVYATLLVYKNKVIGGDITDTAAKGIVQGFRKAQATIPQETTIPSTT